MCKVQIISSILLEIFLLVLSFIFVGMFNVNRVTSITDLLQTTDQRNLEKNMGFKAPGHVFD